MPFLASDSGGTAELVSEADRANCLAPPSGEAFAERLRHILEAGQPPAHMARPQAQTRARWRELVARGEDRAAASKPPRPRVSVCLSAPAGVAIDPAALAAIRGQIDADVEIVVAIYGAAEDRGAAMAEGQIHIARRSPDRAAARNAAAKAASGDG